MGYVVIQGRTTTRTVLIVKFLACNVRLCSNTVLLHELCDTTCIEIISVLRKTKASSKLLSPPLLSYNCPLNKLNHSSNSPMLKGLENLEDEILSSLSVCCSPKASFRLQAACQRRSGAAGQEGCPPYLGSSLSRCRSCPRPPRPK